MSDRKGDLYYNFNQYVGSLENTNKLSEPLKFSSTRGTEILKNPSEYYVSIVQFRISNGTIPIMRYYPESDDRYTDYYIKLVYNGNTYQSLKILDPEYFFDYGSIIDFFNEYLGDVWTKVVAQFPALNTMVKPILNIDPNTNLFYLELDQTFNQKGMTLIFNDRLHKKLPFERKYKGKPDYFTKEIELVIPIIDNPIEGTSYTTEVSHDVRKYMDELTGILFITYGMPVEAEIVGDGDFSQSILTDFEPEESTEGRGDTYDYIPLGRKRSYKIITNKPLRSLDVETRWTSTIDGVEIMFSPNNSANYLKLQFSKNPHEVLA